MEFFNKIKKEKIMIKNEFTEREIEAWKILESIQKPGSLNEEQRTRELKKIQYILLDLEQRNLAARCD